MNDLAPHELIQDSYPIAARSISSLVEIAKVNPNLLQEVIELAIVIGINSAMSRINWESKIDGINKIRDSGLFPKW